jgi:hypothetical protein
MSRIEDGAPQQGRIGMQEFDLGEFLHMGVEQGRMIDHGHQDQRLSRRHAGLAADQRTGLQPWAAGA